MLAPVAEEIRKLEIRSLHAVPLFDKEQPGRPAAAGTMRLAPGLVAGRDLARLKRSARRWSSRLTIPDCAGWSSSLAGTDPETGLLPRSAYLDCLLAEARRSKDQGQPLSVCLLEPENPHVADEILGDAGVQNFLFNLSKALAPTCAKTIFPFATIRFQSSFCFPTLPFPRPDLPSRRSDAPWPSGVNGSDRHNFCAAVCDVPLGPTFDAVDGVTEVINRLETSLDRAHKEVGKRILISRFNG